MALGTPASMLAADGDMAQRTLGTVEREHQLGSGAVAMAAGHPPPENDVLHPAQSDDGLTGREWSPWRRRPP